MNEKINALLTKLQTSINTGLSSKEVRSRLYKNGLNTIRVRKKETLFDLLKNQFADPMLYLLLGAATTLFFFGDQFDAFIISGILGLNLVVGIFQDIRVNSLVERLYSFEVETTLVLRNGEKSIIESSQLVPGDIIFVQRGEKIPADAYLIQTADFAVNEAMLTGESEPVFKQSSAEQEEQNMIYAGSYVVSGDAQAVIVKTGKQTRVGAIYQEVETVSSTMPLQKDLMRLIHFVFIILIALCGALLVIGYVKGIPFMQLVAALLALFICVVPQGLPIIMLIALVAGAYRMAQNKVLVKKLQAIEGLGRVDVVVMDKTGTLSCNELMVTKMVANDMLYDVSGYGYTPKGSITHKGETVTLNNADHDMKMMSLAVKALNKTELLYDDKEELISLKGTSVQAALKVCVEKIGIELANGSCDYELLFEISFDSTRKFHGGIIDYEGQKKAFIVGAPEVIKEKSKTDITQYQSQMLSVFFDEGLRVVAVAQKDITTDNYSEDLFNDEFDFLGFFGIVDTLRKESIAMVGKIKKAGMRIIMATGDNEDTAFHAAKHAGIVQTESEVFHAKEFTALNDEQLGDIVTHKSVFARMLPEDKTRLVRILQEQKQVVAMIGDGVNDAPALTNADLGIAIGKGGTDVAKESSDIILLDNALSGIIAGIEQGRHIFLTLKRVTLYFFTTNFSEMMVMLAILAFGLPLPFLASHILWLNFVTDGLLDISLAFEAKEPHLLEQSWSDDEQQLITSYLVIRIVYQSLLVAAITCGFFYYYHMHATIIVARTMALMVMTACQWSMALNCRSFTKSIMQLSFFSNKWLLFCLVAIPLLMTMLVHSSYGHIIFQVTTLSLRQWSLVGFVALLVLVIEEARKACVKYVFN